MQTILKDACIGYTCVYIMQFLWLTCPISAGGHTDLCEKEIETIFQDLHSYERHLLWAHVVTLKSFFRITLSRDAKGFRQCANRTAAKGADVGAGGAAGSMGAGPLYWAE